VTFVHILSRRIIINFNDFKTRSLAYGFLFLVVLENNMR
jgi:hypothetical protein